MAKTCGITGEKRVARPRGYLRNFLTGSAAAIALSSAARADDAPPVLRNNYGTVGLIDMPSAHMAPDGTLSFGTSFQKNIQRYNFDFQVLPWLAGGFQYSGLRHYDAGYPVYWDRSFSFKARLSREDAFFPDISVGVNDLIGTGIYAGEYLVASKRFGTVDATVGLGWGRNATINTFRNPIALLSKTFENRIYDAHIGETNTQYFRGRAGLFGGVAWQTPIQDLTLLVEYNSDDYALERGRGTFFPRERYNVGVSYKPFTSMTLGLNWIYGDSINANLSFALDPLGDPFPTRMGPTLPPAHVRTDQERQQAINNLLDQRNGTAKAASLAATNRNALVDALWNDGLHDVSVSGRALLVNASGNDAQRLCRQTAQLVAHYDTTIDMVGIRAGGATQKCQVPAQVRAAAFHTSSNATTLAGLALAPASLQMIDASERAASSRPDAITRIQAHAAEQMITIQAITLTDSEAIVYYVNRKYQREKDAVDRLVRVLMADAPAAIEKFRLIAMVGEVPANEFDVLRGPTERAVTQGGRYSLMENGNAVVAPPMQNPVLAQARTGKYPNFSWLVFPQFRQALFDPDNPLGVQFLAGAQATVGLLPGLSLTGEVEYSIYDSFAVTRVSDSVLPHVRTDWTNYFTQGKNGIGELDLQYSFRLTPEIFAKLKAGYLESMFAGVGGEVLWRPEYSRWALGVNLYSVQQRKFDRLFGLQSYREITGHATLYYASPWYDVNFAVSAGQYLAGDRGVTFEISRRFPTTGVELGIFATKTNISSAQFGEGSFDKGFIIRIPIGWSMPLYTQTELATVIRPLQRDGGQRLENSATLYNSLYRTGYGAVWSTGDVLAP